MSREVITPGAALISAGRALVEPKRLAGLWPYQWLFPGPNSRHVLAQNVIAMPTQGAGIATILSYEVPSGMRFSLRGVFVGANAGSWDEGTPTGLQFDLSVVGTGTRKVDFLSGILSHLGSLETPFPILGRLEFQPLDVLTWKVTNLGAVVETGYPNVAFAALVGHTYPNAEAG